MKEVNEVNRNIEGKMEIGDIVQWKGEQWILFGSVYNKGYGPMVDLVDFNGLYTDAVHWEISTREVKFLRQMREDIIVEILEIDNNEN